MRRTALILVGIVLVGCTDKAEKDFRQCEALEAKGDISGAVMACETAARLAPTSKFGVAAKAKREAMAPAFAKWVEQRDLAAKLRKERSEKAAQAAAEVQKAATQRAAAALKGKVHKKYWNKSPDGECTGRAFPPYRWDYEGGTFAEDALVATSDGCVKLHSSPEIQTYCCPERPWVGW